MRESLCRLAFFPQVHRQQYLSPVFKRCLCSIFQRPRPVAVCLVNSQEEIKSYLSVQDVFPLIFKGEKSTTQKTIKKE